MTRPPPTHRDRFPHWEPLQTRWNDNDIYGHMNNAIHYQLFDTAVNNYLLNSGILAPDMRDPVYLVVSTACDYFAELAYPDRIEAGIGIEALGGSSVRYHVGLFRKGEATAAAQGRFVHVNVHPTERSAIGIAPAHRKEFEKLLMT